MINKNESEYEIVLHVKYIVKAGRRNEFLQKVKDANVISESCKEAGNIYYEYNLPLDDENGILLIESWKGNEALADHFETEHFKRLTAFKNEYIESSTITKYQAVKI